MGEATDGPKVETYRLADDGTVPNNALPLVLYRGALKADGDRAAACERMFERNGWPGRNGCALLGAGETAGLLLRRRRQGQHRKQRERHQQERFRALHGVSF